MAIQCVYTDLDGTLLGRGASLFRDAEGNFTLLPARALEACHRAGVEVVLKSGRRKAQVMEDARLLGQTAYIYEVGCGLHIDGEDSFLGELKPRDGVSVWQQIEESGAPRMLLERYEGRLEPHAPWHLGRQFSHLLRGLVDVDEANSLLPDNLRLVDNGDISPKETLLGLEGPPHAYHLIPRGASKADAVAAHMRARGYARDECMAVGDSVEDMGVAEHVGRFFLVANAKVGPVGDNVEVTEGANGEGFYEAVVRTLAESR
jgi:hydroxymethylpyrimidine pyrophosphatase-like HAD family hydrolase